MNIYIAPHLKSFRYIPYTLRLILRNVESLSLSFVDNVQDASLIIDTVQQENGLCVSQNFLQNVKSGAYAYEINLASDKPYVLNEFATIDYISTIFYLSNVVQEYHFKDTDIHRRFTYEKSLQKHYDCAADNIVQQLIDELFSQHPAFRQLKNRTIPSRISLSHDIDTVYGSEYQDGFYALKHLQLYDVFRLLLNVVLQKPDWLNMDKIMRLESEYDFKSTFYWLVLKDKKNSDYNIQNTKIVNHMQSLSKAGWANGLHKAISDFSIDEELALLPFSTVGNRYHFLKYTVPQSLRLMSDSKLKFDSSFGFADHWGFRNNYGMPFMPFDIEENRLLDFVEAPLNVMDGIFYRSNLSMKDTETLLIDWFDKNNTNCVFSINWHNPFFTNLKYSGFPALYRAILTYFKTANIKSVTQDNLITEFYKPEIYQD